MRLTWVHDRISCVKEASGLWINGPLLLQQYATVQLYEVPVTARRINLSQSSGIDGIDKLSESAATLCTLQKKRVPYLIAFLD